MQGKAPFFRGTEAFARLCYTVNTNEHSKQILNKTKRLTREAIHEESIKRKNHRRESSCKCVCCSIFPDEQVFCASRIGCGIAPALVLALCVGFMSGCSSNSYTPEPSEQKIDNSLLHTPGTLRVGVDASNAPYAAQSQGSIVGIHVDTAAALADELGLKLELVDVGTNAEGAFTSDNVDIVMGVGSDAKNCWVSEP